jgi:hypothetical protein
MFLATFARFVARAAGLHMRFVSARVAYADSFGHTHAQNGLLRRMFCTLGMGTNLSRTTNSNFGTLSYLFGANQIHSWRKPSRVRFDNDSIQISLNSILYAAALLGPPLPGPYLLTQRPCLDLRCQALTYVLTSSCDARQSRQSLTQWMFRIVPILLFCFCGQNFWPRIFKGRN